METKKIIRSISCIIMAMLLCLGVGGCTSNQQWEPQTSAIYEAIVPEGVTVTFKDEQDPIQHTYYLQFEGNLFGYIDLHTQSTYVSRYIDDYRNFFRDCGTRGKNTEKLNDQGKRIIYFDFYCESGYKPCAKIRETLYRGEEIIIIDKDYTLAKGKTTIDELVDIPERVTMYCRQGEVYYIVTLFECSEPKSDEWLLGIGLDLSSNSSW